MKQKRVSLVIKGKKGQHLNKREIMMIQDGTVGGFLGFEALENKGVPTVEFFDDGLLPLADFLRMSTMSKRMYTVLLRNIAVTLRVAEEQHFSRNLIELELSSTYVNPATWQVFLMYVPLQPYEAKGSLRTFLLDFAANCIFTGNQNVEYVSELIRNINASVSFTVHMLNAYCDKLAETILQEAQGSGNSQSCGNCGSKVGQEEQYCPYCGTKLWSVPVAQPGGKRVVVGVGDFGEGLSEECPSETVMKENGNGVITIFQGAPENRRKVWLENRKTGDKIVINRWPFCLGRMDQVADYLVQDPAVSRKHAELLREQSCYYITDCGSKNGTYVNRRKVQCSVKEKITDGAELRLGNTEFWFHVD